MPKKKNQAKPKTKNSELTDVELDGASGGTAVADSDLGTDLQAQTLENTSNSSVSNVLKTRHDTAKNALSNVR